MINILKNLRNFRFIHVILLSNTLSTLFLIFWLLMSLLLVKNGILRFLWEMCLEESCKLLKTFTFQRFKGSLIDVDKEKKNRKIQSHPCSIKVKLARKSSKAEGKVRTWPAVQTKNLLKQKISTVTLDQNFVKF